MRKTLLITMLLFAVVFSGCATAQMSKPLPEAMQPKQIKAVMTKVADWQIANPSSHHTADWTSGAYLAGLTAWAEMADTNKYYKALIGFGQKNNWAPHKRVYHADDHVVGQMYLDLYKKYKDPKMLAPTQKRFDEILANQPTTELKMGTKNGQDRWNWCDALFMAPPVWAKLARVTGQSKYLEYMNKEWWATTGYLYDADEHLYYRDSRYFDRREANGEKIFWSRGNGWVFAGLARVLEEMPADYPDRPKYEKLFKDMAAKLVKIQPEEGLWHSSLLDPVSYPTKEASGSGFYCYGLAWGINQGYLNEKRYLPAVSRAWDGLVNCVHADGKLGYVQPIGADPRQVTSDQTEIYGVGSFLLAGSEVYKIALRGGMPGQKITVVNPIQEFRDSETISLDWDDIKKVASGLTTDNVAIFDFKTNRLLVTQVIEDGKDAQVLFQTNLAPGEQKYFWVMKLPGGFAKPQAMYGTYCRFMPERKDDFGWESDKAAYRMYGPALEYETITCGIDAWGKCVPYPVLNKFIWANNHKGIPYHDDHGEGGDFFKVGNTLGCGGMAPFVDNKVCLPRNFVTSKVITNGPIRSTFELTYKPWKAGSYTVSETKRISIDLGSNLSRIECRYACDNSDTLPVAAGIILRDNSDQTWTDDQIIAYWLPADGGFGQLGNGVVFGADAKTKVTTADSHLLLTLSAKVNEPVVYYSGSCWDKNAEFSSYDKWQSYLKNFKQRIDNPVNVSFAD